MTDELTEAVEALTKIRIEKIRTDNGILVVTGDPRLQMLAEAVRSSMNGRGGGTSMASERAALNSDALHKALVIQSQIGDWCRIAGVKPTRNATVDLEAWHSALEDGDHEWHVAQLDKWAAEIDAMLSPPKRFDITSACPVCQATTFTNADGNVCKWPLKGDEDTLRVVCMACDSSWDGLKAAEELRDELVERDTPEKVES